MDRTESEREKLELRSNFFNQNKHVVRRFWQNMGHRETKSTLGIKSCMRGCLTP